MKRLVALSGLIVLLAIAGCSFEYSAELAGSMSVSEVTGVDGQTDCSLYARKRTLREVVNLVAPKVDGGLALNASVDQDLVIDEIDIKDESWRAVIEKLASTLDLEVVESDMGLELSAKS